MFSKERATGKIAHLGRILVGTKNAIALSFPAVFSKARGRGYLQGLALTSRAAAFVRDLRRLIVEHGALLEIMSGAGCRSQGLPYSFPAIRVAPPLIADRDDLEAICESIRAGTQAFVESRK